MPRQSGRTIEIWENNRKVFGFSHFKLSVLVPVTSNSASGEMFKTHDNFRKDSTISRPANNWLVTQTTPANFKCDSRTTANTTLFYLPASLEELHSASLEHWVIVRATAIPNYPDSEIYSGFGVDTFQTNFRFSRHLFATQW